MQSYTEFRQLFQPQAKKQKLLLYILASTDKDLKKKIQVAFSRKKRRFLLFSTSNPSNFFVNRSSDYLFHLLKLAIIDLNETLAETLLHNIGNTFLKKKRQFDSCFLFLLALSNRMEKLCIVFLEKGFPIDPNHSIFFLKKSRQFIPISIVTQNVVPTINSSLFPSYMLLAACYGYIELLRTMIKLGSSVNNAWNGVTPLHVAVLRNDLYMTGLLLENGADPWKGCSLEQYELMISLKNSYNPSVSDSSKVSGQEFLLLLSVPQKLPAFYRTSQDSSEHHNALSDQNLIAANFHNLSIKGDSSALLSAETAHKFLKSEFEEWKRSKIVLPLTLASLMGHEKATLLLLSKMYDKGQKRKLSSILSLFSPREEKSSTPAKSNNLARLYLRRSEGLPSKVPQRSSTSVQTNSDASISAVKDGLSLLVQKSPKITTYLLKSNSVDINQKDPYGNTPLHLAVRTNNLEIIKILLYFDGFDKALIDSRGENGFTCLHESIANKNLELYRYLVKRGANINIKNNFGDTAIDLAIKLGFDSSEVHVSNISKHSTSTMLASSEMNQELDTKLIKLLQTPLSFEEVSCYLEAVNSTNSSSTSIANTSERQLTKADRRRTISAFDEKDSSVDGKEEHKKKKLAKLFRLFKHKKKKGDLEGVTDTEEGKIP